MYLFDDDYPQTIPNNSIVLTDKFGQIPSLQCISGSSLPNIGQWLSPSGQDVSQSSLDPFDAVSGDLVDPGYINLSMHFGRVLSIHDQGIYSCHIPNEFGENTSVTVGIYLPSFTSM